MKEDIRNISKEKVISRFKTNRIVSFSICLLLLIIVILLSIYSLLELTKNNEISKYAGELFTELVIIVFLSIGISFIIKLLRIKEESILTQGMAIEKTIGKRGILFIILSIFLISYSVAMYATLIQDYEVRRLIIATITIVFSIPSFYIGILLLKINAALYNYNNNQKGEQHA